MKKKNYVLTGTMLVLTFALIASSPSLVSAKTGANYYTPSRIVSQLHRNFQLPITGTVTSLSGTTITLTSKNSTIYTINATNAKLIKNGVSATIANILIGDTLFVRGAVTGTSVAATNILDGKPTLTTKKHTVETKKLNMNLGTITAINASGFTMQRVVKHATSTITVNTTNTTIFKKNGQTAVFSDLLVGQRVLVNGTYNSTTGVIDPVLKVSIITKKPLVKTTKNEANEKNHSTHKQVKKANNHKK